MGVSSHHNPLRVLLTYDRHVRHAQLLADKNFRHEAVSAFARAVKICRTCFGAGEEQERLGEADPDYLLQEALDSYVCW